MVMMKVNFFRIKKKDSWERPLPHSLSLATASCKTWRKGGFRVESSLAMPLMKVAQILVFWQIWIFALFRPRPPRRQVRMKKRSRYVSCAQHLNIDIKTTDFTFLFLTPPLLSPSNRINSSSIFRAQYSRLSDTLSANRFLSNCVLTSFCKDKTAKDQPWVFLENLFFRKVPPTKRF